MTYDFVKIGRRIAGERVRKGWNQTELINQLSQMGVRISRNTISKLESGKLDETNIPVDLIIGLCELFGCEAGYLLGEEGYRGKTRSATDVSKVTGLDAEAIEGLKQIMKGDFDIDGQQIGIIHGEYDDFYRMKYSDFDITHVVNWLFKNDNFKDLIVYLSYKLMTVGYSQVHVPDFVSDIKAIFEDYHNDRMPMMVTTYDDWAKMFSPVGWDEYAEEHKLSPEEKAHIEKIWGDYMRSISNLIPFPADD